MKTSQNGYYAQWYEKLIVNPISYIITHFQLLSLNILDWFLRLNSKTASSLEQNLWNLMVLLVNFCQVKKIQVGIELPIV